MAHFRPKIAVLSRSRDRGASRHIMRTSAIEFA